MTASTFFIALIVLSVALITSPTSRGMTTDSSLGPLFWHWLRCPRTCFLVPGNISGRVEEKQQKQTQAEPTPQPTESEPASSTYEISTAMRWMLPRCVL